MKTESKHVITREDEFKVSVHTKEIGDIILGIFQLPSVAHGPSYEWSSKDGHTVGWEFPVIKTSYNFKPDKVTSSKDKDVGDFIAAVYSSMFTRNGWDWNTVTEIGANSSVFKGEKELKLKKPFLYKPDDFYTLGDCSGR